MRRKMSEDEVNRIVSAIDATRRDLFSMDHVDKPAGKAFSKRGRQDIRITRAKTRLRTAAWRKRNAETRTATADQVSRAILASLMKSSAEDLFTSDRNLLARVLTDLHARGFDVKATKKSLWRMRGELIGQADSEGETFQEGNVLMQLQQNA